MTIYVNRTLNLKKIKVIGFDMDHTIIRYKTEHFEALAFSELIHKLIEKKNYPEEIRKIKFHYDRVVRGLVIDIQKGNLLKLSLYGRVKDCYHGSKQLTYKEMRPVYRGLFVDIKDDRYATLDTAFSVSVCALYSALIDMRDSGKINAEYDEIWNDLMEALNLSHMDGSLKGEVEKNPDHFIIKDQVLVETLERFKRDDKKLIIVTNSDYHYSKVLLDFAIDPFLKDHISWKDLFEIVVTYAEKPRFFTERRRFLKVNPQDGMMINWDRPIEKGSIYQGGNSKDLEEYFGLSGEKILYLGDHIFGDVVSLKKASNWRTALVIDELENEINSLKKGQKTLDEIDVLMEKKESFEWDFFNEQDKDKSDKIYSEIKKVDEKLSKLIPQYQKYFNPYWGPIMRAGQEESYYAHKISQYACIYMDKISDFAYYSSKHYFRPKRRALPHD